MSRPRSPKVNDVKLRLRTRLREGVYRPGDRFFSARALAAAFSVSYQTADRLIRELCDEGLLERRAASGTYIPGGAFEPTGVQLVWNTRAQRAGSFGARLLDKLRAQLRRDHIDVKVTWSDAGGKPVRINADRFTVLWESPAALAACIERRRSALLLNDRPPPGLGAAFVDSVSIDDYSGGVCAAQLLPRGAGRRDAAAGYAVLTGPVDDRRSSERRDGFLSLVPTASVVSAGSWFFEDGYQVAAKLVANNPAGVFCCNDRLAEAVVAYCHENELAVPSLVGFDDAPIAEEINLTTISVPWDEMVAGAGAVIKQRLAGDSSVARQLILTPLPVMRGL